MLNSETLILLSLAALVSTTCARNVFDLKSYIVNGQTAVPAQFPFTALLRAISIDGSVAGHCTGSLINEQWILTAGHCVHDDDTLDRFEVFLGVTNLTDPTEEGRVLAISREAFQHPEYSSFHVQNDVALLKLENPVQFSETVQAVNLTEKATLETGSKVTAIGFGLQHTFATSLSETLQYAELVHITREECARIFPFVLHRVDVICAKGMTYESTCNGDSGGPLVVYENGKPKLIATTSFGHKAGCHLGIPVAFSNVASSLDWIEHTIYTN